MEELISFSNGRQIGSGGYEWLSGGMVVLTGAVSSKAINGRNEEIFLTTDGHG
jgi:hypothetical protein